MFSELFAYLRICFGNNTGKDNQSNTFYLSDINNNPTGRPYCSVNDFLWERLRFRTFLISPDKFFKNISSNFGLMSLLPLSVCLVVL